MDAPEAKRVSNKRVSMLPAHFLRLPGRLSPLGPTAPKGGHRPPRPPNWRLRHAPEAPVARSR
eukprot:15467880-Alexandrium_andersonii.AAC.1